MLVKFNNEHSLVSAQVWVEYGSLLKASYEMQKYSI